MKKTITLVSSMFAMAAAIIVSTSSCKKDEPAPSTPTVTGVTLVRAYTSDVIMNNQLGSSSQYGKLNTTSVGFSTSSDFDLAYGNGGATGNTYFIGGSNDPSVQAVYSISGTSQTTFKVVASSVTTSVFDTLTNSKAVVSIVDAATNVDNGVGILPTRIRSGSSWAVGTVFAFQTSGGRKAVAKVTAAPSGTTTAVGSIGLSIKFF